MTERALARAVRAHVIAHRRDLLALGLLAIAAALFLSPALKDGLAFGGFDYDTMLSSLGAGLYPVVHSQKNGDAVSQMVSWNALDWRLIHAGHFPLWNDDAGLGMPEFANFESSVLSLPDLVSYVFPLRMAFLVAVYVKLLIASTGTYVFVRVLRARELAAFFAGVSFMFAGAFATWVTWPLSDVVAWIGWICAFGTLAYQTRRVRYAAGLAVAVAWSFYGGFPEASLLMTLALGVAVLGVAISAAVGRARISIPGVLHVVGGAVGGALLSMPLWWPGLQVISGSHRATERDAVGLPLKTLPLLIAQGYYGLPTGHTASYALSASTKLQYYETVSYVGVIALVLTAVALICGIRRPAVVGLGLALVVGLILVFEPAEFHPLRSALDHLGPLSEIRYERMRSVVAFLVAVLGALGLERIISSRDRLVRRSFGGAIGLSALAIATVGIEPLVHHIANRAGGPHAVSLALPLACLAVLVLAFVATSERARERGEVVVRIGCFGLVGMQSAFLFFSGVGIASYSHTFDPATAAELRLESIVGDSLVGIDTGQPGTLQPSTQAGFYPEVNIGYGIRLFAIHDPLTPNTYFSSWPEPVKPTNGGVGLFVPDIDTAALARRYGVQYVLAGSNVTARDRSSLAGMERVGVLNGETLYKVPGATRFSFVRGPDAHVVAVSGSAAGMFVITTSSTRAATLVLRVTDVPGWHVTIDGHRATLQRYDGVMQYVVVPPGAHTVRLWYLPGRFVAGVVVALVTLAASLLGPLGIFLVRRRRRPNVDRAPVT